jgi:transposase-like protein
MEKSSSRKHYSIKTRNEVLQRMIMDHEPGKKVSADLNIPYNTVLRWVREERDNFLISPSSSSNANNQLNYHQVFGYQDQSRNELTEIKRQMKAMRFELQVLTSQNQELMEMLREIIANGDLDDRMNRWYQ